MGKRNRQVIDFLARLVKNQAGNTMAIVAASLIPLAALIGGGVDMSRAYMAKARLQQACDAGALAGRRSMTTSSMTSADIAEATKFFNFNFPQNTFQTDSFTPNIRSDPSQTTTVLVSATTRIPTTIMRILGFQYINLDVSCSSKFDIGNTDVMLVLDTTGSMDSSISNGSGGTTTRIAALRQAVRDFYDTLGPGDTNTGRVRYGFTPYASNVNVGYLLPTTALVGGATGDTWAYNSRIGTFYRENGSSTATCYMRRGDNTCHATSAAANSSSSGSTYSKNSCINWGNASQTTSGTAPSNTSVTTYSYDSWNGDTSTNPSGSGDKKCVRKAVTVTKTYETSTTGGAGWTRYGWQYQVVNHVVSDYITGATVANPAYDAGTTTRWSGCIEEPDTVNTINSSTSTSSVPSGANDLNIDLIPSSAATRWRPFWPDVSWYRTSTPASSPYWSSWTGDQAACPTQARPLAEYASRDSAPSNDPSATSFNAYVDSLTPWGFTNHTTGMIWGARMMSPDGIFAANNGAAPNGFSISRHIIFMTDGAMTASDGNYDGWGINRLDGRIAATGTSTTDLVTIQNKRFNIACEAAKRKGFTIWVIVFASSSNSALNACASSSDHVAVSTNAAALSTQFKTIAQNIGGLRLSQ
ncbi:MAG TPA: pilus assembly protein TadG [Sphingobium sp.]|nr:pilus assembly protein TadG [Sphingobium sp.]